MVVRLASSVLHCRAGRLRAGGWETNPCLLVGVCEWWTRCGTSASATGRVNSREVQGRNSII